MVKYVKSLRLVAILILMICSNLYSQSFIGISINPNISNDANFKYPENPYAPLVTLDFGLIYSYPLNNKISLKTGLGYSVKGYKYNLNLYNPIDPDSPLLTGKEGKVIDKNLIIEIPMLFAYNFINNDHLIFYSELGLLNNFPFKEEMGSSNSFSKQKNALKFYVPGIQVSVGLEVKIFSKFYCSISPTFKYLIHSTSENLAKCYSVGAQVGLKYQLSN